MTDISHADFDYILMPGKASTNFGNILLYNQLYTFWKEFWVEILYEVTGERRRLTADDFVRQDYFAILRFRGEIVSMHAYSFFNLHTEAARDHTYFRRYFNEGFIQKLAEHQTNTVMTMEYFSVAKPWRGVRLGVSLATLLVALGLRLAEQNGVDGTITAARADVPAARIASRLGAIPLVEPVAVHGKPTELMLFPSGAVTEPHDGVYKEWLDGLWNSRIDLVAEDRMPDLKRIA